MNIILYNREVSAASIVSIKNPITGTGKTDSNNDSWSFTETLSSGPDTISLTDFKGESFTSTMSITVESTSSSSSSSSGP